MSHDPLTVPKVLGADVELGNFIVGPERPEGTGRRASRLLLQEIDGVLSQPPVFRPDDPQDAGRRFLPGNGGCAYIDLDHLELALPETRSAFDFVTYWRAMLRLAATGLAAANQELPECHRIQVLVNCSDGLGQSYGSHINVLLTRRAWDAIMLRKPHYLAYLAAFQVSSIVYTGQGKVGSENGRRVAPYQLAQRADFVETYLGLQTTYQRPLVNTRDEPLCGRERWHADTDLARLHVIFYDSTLCDVATLLKVGTLQMVVAMIEAERVDPTLALDDPLEALERWSGDPTLSTRARTVGGDAVTAVELQGRFLAAARRFADTGGFDASVARAAEILALWHDTLQQLRARDVEALAGRLDWVLKHRLLQRAMEQRGLGWDAPAIKHLDLLYASLDPRDGLYWACERSGLIERLVSEAAVQRAVSEPPDDTRAWTRARLLRALDQGDVSRVDWDEVSLWVQDPRGLWATRTVRLPHPCNATRRDHEAAFAPGRRVDEIVEDLCAPALRTA
jgi:hypothetical protein